VGTWRLVAGGVAGRGAAAAVLAGLAGEALRVPAAAGPAAALARLDDLVRATGAPDGQVGAVCADLARRGHGFTLTAARAGHPAPLVLRSTGVVLSLDAPDAPWGGRREPAELGLELQPGDALLLCAGGTGQAGSACEHRLGAVLAGCAGWAPVALLEHVMLALAERRDRAWDGASFLALRVSGGRTRTPARSWLPA